MNTVEMKLVFTSEDGTSRVKSYVVPAGREHTPAGERRLAHDFAIELNIEVRGTAAPRHSAVAIAWLEFPRTAYDPTELWNVQNSQELWRELTNLVLASELDLLKSQAYKKLEPKNEPAFEKTDEVENLHYIHNRKMELLNSVVYNLVKVQDLVNRLLHESLGGDLVDSSKNDWEKNELRRDKVKQGLIRKQQSGSMRNVDCVEIARSLEKPERTVHRDLLKDYRNRLTHHIRPSVDYAMFYSELASRLGTAVSGPDGKIIRWVHTFLALPKAMFRFEDLFIATYEYLDAVVEMLTSLSRLPSLHL